MKTTVMLILLLVARTLGWAQTYMITDFGASTDSNRINTKAIQLAINTCNIRGGGEVTVPAGIFYTGTILLASNVYLRLLPGAILQGSYDPADYPAHDITAVRKYGTIVHNGFFVNYLKALVIADSIDNTGIVGEGTIRGAGEGKGFQLGENKDGKPMNILFIRCTGVLLKGIRVLNAAQVTISLSGCDKVQVDGIYVSSLVNWNTDGMDVDARDAVISNCIIDSEDDALCFKSEYADRFCENITATNCIVSSNCNGIKLGTGSRTGFRNITVSNCVVKRPSQDILRKWNRMPGIFRDKIITSVNTGIVILGVDGGTVENINFSNIIMTDVITPITVRVGKRFLNASGKPSVMRHITLQNITAEGVSIIPSVIAGIAESPVTDLTLSAIHIRLSVGVTADSLKLFPPVIPENEKSYPENRMFGLKLPASGFYVRHVNGLSLKDVSIEYAEPDVRPAFYLDDVNAVLFKSVLIGDKKMKDTPAMLISTSAKAIEIVE